MAKPHTIYALADPYDQAVRYVGETANVQRRYREHCRGETGVKVAGWVAELKEQGMFPVLLILETDVVGRMAIKREWYWTKMYLMQGAALLNFTPETRERFTSDNGLIH